MPQPQSNARTRFRPGSRTSLPMNVTFVHAVWAKTGPTIAFPKSSTSASAPTNGKPGCAACGLHPFAHESHHPDERAADAELHPNDNPTITTPARAAVFAKVNVFRTMRPISKPRVFVQVSREIKAMATSCSVERLMA